MRQCGALGMGLLTWLLAGCVTPAAPPADWPKQPAAVRAPAAVQLEIALLECPVGDHYINAELWNNFADERILSPERQAVLEDNGLRVALLGGLVPEELQELLTSRRSNVNPCKRQVHVGHPVALNLGPLVPFTQFTAIDSQQGEPVETQVVLDQAQFRLMVMASITPEGKVKLHFTPEVEHGEEQKTFLPAPDGSGWMMKIEHPRLSYPALAWDVTLDANQYLVMGTRFDQRSSLGYASFVQAGKTSGVQRLLVIRISRPGATLSATEDEEKKADVCSRQAPPLALQAQVPWATARGSSR